MHINFIMFIENYLKTSQKSDRIKYVDSTATEQTLDWTLIPLREENPPLNLLFDETTCINCRLFELDFCRSVFPEVEEELDRRLLGWTSQGVQK